MRQLFWTAVIATWACCAAAQTFTVVQNQPQAVTESPNATKGDKASSAKSGKSDETRATAEAKKSRKAKSAASNETAAKSASGNVARSESKKNKTPGNTKVASRTTGRTKPTRHNKETQPAAAETAKAQPVPQPAPASEPKPAPKPLALSGPATPPYRAPAWLPQSPDSNTLRSQIESALTQDQSLVGSKVDVAVDDSHINLAGVVPGTREKLAAERIARSFAGNRKVENKLTVAAQAAQPASSEPQPAPQRMNNAQPSQTLPAASFAPQNAARPADVAPGEANTVESTPATAGENPRPRIP